MRHSILLEMCPPDLSSLIIPSEMLGCSNVVEACLPDVRSLSVPSELLGCSIGIHLCLSMCLLCALSLSLRLASLSSAASRALACRSRSLLLRSLSCSRSLLQFIFTILCTVQNFLSVNTLFGNTCTCAIFLKPKSTCTCANNPCAHAQSDR